ncbi:macB-like periplasmic core domain protein [Burkholderia thailandensis]|uniref:MacB-like periplasmic core domain protein n=1 Tax=Burkholderia thailandensis TaxID=57975 RepID=A0AAW9CLX2_BURTH|nr:macB-like periplasmic core domain protein [Burkholderia thailandensis]MDW9251585.1 macB-like periplasmic core domain protein [Burkholderia thailandensis]
MKTWVLAFRNLSRNRRRSSTTLLAMIVGLTAILLFGGYALNIHYGLQTSFVRYGGHLQIQRRDYFLYGSGDPISYGIADYERVIDVVAHDPELSKWTAVVTPVLAVNGIAGNFEAGVSRTVSGSGVVVADQNRMREWNDCGFPGEAARADEQRAERRGDRHGRRARAAPVRRAEGARLPRSGTGCGARCARQRDRHPRRRRATVGARDRRPADARPARIELLTSNAYGAPNVEALDVIAAQKQGVKEIDDMFVQLHLGQAQRLVDGNGSDAKVTSIVIQLKHKADIGRARAHRDAAAHARCGRAARRARFRDAQSAIWAGGRHVRRHFRLHRGADRDDRDVYGRQHDEHGGDGAHPRNRHAARDRRARRGHQAHVRLRRLSARRLRRGARHAARVRRELPDQSRATALDAARPDGTRAAVAARMGRVRHDRALCGGRRHGRDVFRMAAGASRRAARDRRCAALCLTRGGS